MRRCRPAAPAAVLAMALAAPLLLQGCQTNMSNDASADAQRDEAAASGELYSPWPLKFKKHNLGIHCFDTYGCKVVYDGRVQAMDDPEVLQPSSASLGADYRKNWFGGRLGIRNFPPPAKVSWKSKDGTAHESSIAIGQIFNDEVVRHNVSWEEIPQNATFINPDIHLEINDRTINVYMLASIPLKNPSVPGNRYSDMQYDLTLVYTEAF
ncbi:hypothetical protein WCE41_09415 [Luteimonas sp. MJ246]|uniref:hypothetical protein n=1 Tax=Luteimonas sp. MJ174 TaxID=3129237 RepID=UPI0031BAED72